ncbi:MAG: restriction endonuclease subunit S [Leptothrix sp. (in: b-proteobacteria)]
MSAVLEAREPRASYLAALQPPLVRQFDLLASAPGGVARLRELILTLAVQGKLVPQDPSDEPASVLLRKIRAEKDRLIAAGKIKRDKDVSPIREEEMPFELQPGWAWVRFGESSINRDGERIPVSSSDRESRSKIYDYYGASGVIDKIDGYLFDKTLLLIGEDGANLINRSTPIAFLAHGKYWVNNHAHVIDTTHPALMDYLALFINAISLEPYVTGTAQPKMNQAKLNSIVVALPPLAEQSRIVTRVEELMRLCDALESQRQLETAQHAQLLSTLLGTLTDSTSPDELAANWQRVSDHFDLLLDRPQAVDALEQTILQLAVRGLLVPQDPTDEPASVLLQQIRAEKDRLIAAGKIKQGKVRTSISDEAMSFDLHIGWERVRFGDYIFEICTGPFGSLIHKEDYVHGGVPLINPSHMKGGRIEHDPEVTVSQAMAVNLDAYKISSGDIILARRGEVGRYALVTDREAGWLCGTGSFFVKLHASCNHNYLGLMLDDPAFRMHLQGESVGSTMTNLNQRILVDSEILIPPLAEQTRIVARVNQLRSLCADLRQRLSARQTTQRHLAEALVEV